MSRACVASPIAGRSGSALFATLASEVLSVTAAAPALSAETDDMPVEAVGIELLEQAAAELDMFQVFQQRQLEELTEGLPATDVGDLLRQKCGSQLEVMTRSDFPETQKAAEAIEINENTTELPATFYEAVRVAESEAASQKELIEKAATPESADAAFARDFGKQLICDAETRPLHDLAMALREVAYVIDGKIANVERERDDHAQELTADAELESSETKDATTVSA